MRFVKNPVTLPPPCKQIAMNRFVASGLLINLQHIAPPPPPKLRDTADNVGYVAQQTMSAV